MNDPNYWEDLDVEGWRSEITDMRSMIANYGQIAEEDIIGECDKVQQNSYARFALQIHRER